MLNVSVMGSCCFAFFLVSIFLGLIPSRKIRILARVLIFKKKTSDPRIRIPTNISINVCSKRFTYNTAWHL